MKKDSLIYNILKSSYFCHFCRVCCLGKWEKKSCFIHGIPNCFIDLFHFLHVVNYKSVKWEPFSMNHRLITKAKFKNPWNKSTAIIRKQACLCCNFLFLFIMFLFIISFEMGFSLDPLCHTKHHGKCIFIHSVS